MISHLMLPSAASLVLGAALLLAGRRLFWLAVGLSGFLFGMAVGLQVGPDSQGLRFAIAILLGLGGMLLAKSFQRIAVALVGFFLGGATLVELLDRIGGHRPEGPVAFLVAGIVAAILALWLFEIALVVLSSWLGAVLVVAAFDPRRAMLMVLLLFAAGVAVQMSYEPRRRAAE